MKLKHCLLPCLLLASSGCKQEPPAAAPSAAEAKTAVEAKPETAVIAEPSSPAMPSLKIATIDGAQYDLAAKRGGWVVVNFWATWCRPCVAELPYLQRITKRYKDKKVKLMLVSLDLASFYPDKIKKFVKFKTGF